MRGLYQNKGLHIESPLISQLPDQPWIKRWIEKWMDEGIDGMNGPSAKISCGRNQWLTSGFFFWSHILLLLLFPRELEPSFSLCPLQHRALKQNGGWIEMGRGGWGIRPVNNPLHSVRANKNANARERRDAIVRRGSTRVSGSLFSSSFFLFPPPTLLPSFVFSTAVGGDGTDTAQSGEALSSWADMMLRASDSLQVTALPRLSARGYCRADTPIGSTT